MSTGLENKCRNLINNCAYEECEREIINAMVKNPHSPIPHNLMGILMERENNHISAMKHFRAAYALDPSYIPARHNIEEYGKIFHRPKCSYCEDDLIEEEEGNFDFK